MISIIKAMKMAGTKVSNDESLVKLLEKKIAGWEPERSHKTVHLSDLSKDNMFCSREFALLDVLKKERKGKYINPALRVTFDNGVALAALCTDKWLVDEVVGSWECRGCTSMRVFTKRPKNKCLCGVRDWKYREEVFVDPESGASGSIDFFIDFGTGKHRTVEVKTISKDEFKVLKAPLAEHRIRTNLYLQLIARSTRPEKKYIDTSWGWVLYISKGFGAKQDSGKVTPFKEFMVESDPKVAKPYFDLARPLKVFRDGGPMPRGVCPTPMCKRSYACPVAKECFSGDYPVGKKWLS